MIILSLIGIDSPKILEIIQLQILTFILVELRIISEKINRENENKNKMKIQLIKHKTGYIGISDGIPQLNYEGYFYSLYNNKIYHTSKYIITVECKV